MHVGRVVSSNGGALVIRLDDRYTADDIPLKRGDGVVVDRGVSCSRMSDIVASYLRRILIDQVLSHPSPDRCRRRKSWVAPSTM